MADVSVIAIVPSATGLAAGLLTGDRWGGRVPTIEAGGWCSDCGLTPDGWRHCCAQCNGPFRGSRGVGLILGDSVIRAVTRYCLDVGRPYPRRQRGRPALDGLILFAYASAHD